MAILPGTWKPKAQESQFMARLDNFVRLSLKIKDKEKKKIEGWMRASSHW